MTTNYEREALIKRLRSKKHRDAFVSAYVDKTIPFQIRALRLTEERNWTQKELASRAGMKQERISVCENPNYGRFSLQTLKQIAAAFDVALIVRLAPFSELVEWESNLSPESLEVKNFDKEEYFKEREQKEISLSLLKEQYSLKTKDQQQVEPKALTHLSDFRQKTDPEKIDQRQSATQESTARGMA